MAAPVGTTVGRGTVLPTLWIPGEPRPKGSLRPAGRRYGRGPVRLIEQVAGSTDWLTTQYNALQVAVRVPCKGCGQTGRDCSGWRLPVGLPDPGCVVVSAVWLVEMTSAEHKRADALPTAATHGDLDKLMRSLGDALERAGIVANDRLITRWNDPRKRFVGSVAAPLRGVFGIEGPGVLVKVERDAPEPRS